jgi:hypothetical protein
VAVGAVVAELEQPATITSALRIASAILGFAGM